MSRRSFGLANGSALATVPSMIDDNELASQTVLDESDVFDDPFYEALVAVGLDDEEADADSVSDDAAPEAPEANATSAHVQESAPAPGAEEQGVSENTVPDAGAADDDAPIRGAHARRPDAAGADATPVAAPENDTEPYEFSLATGSALAMLPSMIDDNEQASQTVVEPFEVFDDPFYEALMAVEPQPDMPEAGQAAKAEETAANASEDEAAPSQNEAAVEPEHADAEEETSESPVEFADEVAEPLYTTASALVNEEPEGVPESVSDVSPAAADAESEEAPEQAAPAPTPESSSDVATPAVDDGPHAAAQEPEATPASEAQAETLPDDESVADAVDEMVINADPDEDKAPADASDDVSAAPKKRGLWSRIKGFFRRNR